MGFCQARKEMVLLPKLRYILFSSFERINSFRYLYIHILFICSFVVGNWIVFTFDHYGK